MAMKRVDVPNELLQAAMDALGAKTKRETITTALEAAVRRHAQVDALAAIGDMDFSRDLRTPRSGPRRDGERTGQSVDHGRGLPDIGCRQSCCDGTFRRVSTPR